RHTAAAAGRARLLDDHPPSAALRAGLAERERALVLLDRAAARAARADDRAGAGRRTRAVARRTGRLARDVDRRGDAIDRVEERQVQLRLEVVAARRSGAAATRRPPATEQSAEQITEVAEVADEREPLGARAGREAATTHRPQPAHLVVLLALLG